MPLRPCVSRHWTECKEKAISRCCPGHSKVDIPMAYVGVYDPNAPTPMSYEEKFTIYNKVQDHPIAPAGLNIVNAKVKLVYCFICHRMNPFRDRCLNTCNKRPPKPPSPVNIGPEYWGKLP